MNTRLRYKLVAFLRSCVFAENASSNEAESVTETMVEALASTTRGSQKAIG